MAQPVAYGAEHPWVGVRFLAEGLNARIKPQNKAYITGYLLWQDRWYLLDQRDPPSVDRMVMATIMGSDRSAQGPNGYSLRLAGGFPGPVSVILLAAIHVCSEFVEISDENEGCNQPVQRENGQSCES